jgi:hypothetical protein
MARMYVTQRYDPVFIEPNMKEYEVQVRFGFRRFATGDEIISNSISRLCVLLIGSPNERAD